MADASGSALADVDRLAPRTGRGACNAATRAGKTDDCRPASGTCATSLTVISANESERFARGQAIRPGDRCGSPDRFRTQIGPTEPTACSCELAVRFLDIHPPVHGMARPCDPQRARPTWHASAGPCRPSTGRASPGRRRSRGRLKRGHVPPDRTPTALESGGSRAAAPQMAPMAGYGPCFIPCEELAMQINKLVFGGLMVGCLAAAGGGAYLATRHNAPTQTAATAPAADGRAGGAARHRLRGRRRTASPLRPRRRPQPRHPSGLPRPRRHAGRPRRRLPRRGATRRPRGRRTARPAPPVEPAPAPAAAPVASGGSMWESRPAVQAEAPEQRGARARAGGAARARSSSSSSCRPTR